jgi:hypothetical protein
MQTAVQLNIGIPNSPGSLAHMSDMLRAAEVNIEALFCTEGAKETMVHLIVDDVETAKLVLRKVGNVTTTEVICIKTKNQPGAIANLARKCAGAQINIRHVYATSIGKESMVYLAVEDLEKAKKALK